MFEAIKRLLSNPRRYVFTFAVDDFPGKNEDLGVDDIVGPDLGRELGVFVVQEKGHRNNRVLVVDTDNDISSQQILDIFRRRGVSARLLEKKE